MPLTQYPECYVYTVKIRSLYTVIGHECNGNVEYSIIFWTVFSAKI